MCTQGRINSVCASAQSYSPLYLPADAWDPWLRTECHAKTLIWQCECANWSEFLLGTHISILLEIQPPSSITCIIRICKACLKEYLVQRLGEQNQKTIRFIAQISFILKWHHNSSRWHADFFFFFFLLLRENEAWHFMQIVCLAASLHEMWSLIFFDK